MCNRVVFMNLGKTSATNFYSQISELKRVINDFRSNENNKPLSLLDFDSRIFIIQNAMDSIVSYLRISNSIDHKYSLSKFQKVLSLNLHMLKLSLDESKLIRLLESGMRELESGNYVEIRNPFLDGFIKKMNNNLCKIEEIVDEFLLKKGYFSMLKNFLFNDTFGSLYQFKIELLNRFNCEEVKINTVDKIKLDALLIRASSPEQSISYNISRQKSNSKDNSLINIQQDNNLNKKEKTNDNSVMIICCPNSAPYEIFAYSDKWIEYYLDIGVSVFLWNYRGFGESKGSLSFENLREDAECVADFLRKFYKFNKIGVHGISIGGIPASHLAAKNLVDLCFLDRTFSSVNEIIYNNSYGFFMNLFYKALLFRNSDNVDCYIKSNSIKIISCDPNDNIIKELSSLKTGISFKTISSLYSKGFLDAQGINNNRTKSLLEIIFDNKNELNEFYNGIIYTLEKINNYNYEGIQNSSRETHLKNEEVSVVTQSNKLISTNYEKLNIDTNQMQSKDFDFVLNSDENIKQRDESKVLLSLKIMIEKFDSAGDTLLSLVKHKVSNKKKFINVFFSNLLIWGSYKIGNVYATDKLIIFRAASKKFSLLNLKISKVINQPNKYYISDNKLIDSLKVLLKGFIKIESFYNKVIFKNTVRSPSTRSIPNLSILPDSSRDFYVSERESYRSIDNNISIENKKYGEDVSISLSNENLNIESYKSVQLSDIIKNLNIGNLIPLKCGHNGGYNEKEIEMYSLYLLNSKFIN